MNVVYSIDEQETTINVFPAQVSDRAEIFSCIPSMMKKLSKLEKDHPDDVVLTKEDGYIKATVPREWIKVAPKRKSNMTDAHKQANIERLAAYRAQKEAEKNATS